MRSALASLAPAVVVAALALVSVLVHMPAAAESVDVARFIPLVATVLKVEAPTREGRTNVGTAITVAPGVVVTSCHVTRDAVSVRVVKRGGRWPVAGQLADWNHDLCFLSVPSWPGEPVPIAASAPPALYAPVVAAGFTRGAELSMSQGEVTGLHGHEGARIIQSTSRFSSGASGGALFDREGRLVGVLTFRLKGNWDHYFSVPASWVRDRLPIADHLFEPVGRSGGGRAFWEGGCCVPYFMQVGELRSQAKWPELLALSDLWIAYDSEDADAWLVRGVAQARLGRHADAVAALERATGIAPRHAEAWYELGIASMARADDAGVRRAQEALADLGSDLAGRLTEAQSSVAVAAPSNAQGGLQASGQAGARP